MSTIIISFTYSHRLTVVLWLWKLKGKYAELTFAHILYCHISVFLTVGVHGERGWLSG